MIIKTKKQTKNMYIYKKNERKKKKTVNIYMRHKGIQ